MGYDSVKTDKDPLAENKMGGGREDFYPRVYIFCIFLHHCSEVTVAEKYARKTRPQFFFLVSKGCIDQNVCLWNE